MASSVDQFNKMADFITARLTGVALQAPQPPQNFEEAKKELLDRMKEVQSSLAFHRSDDTLTQSTEAKRWELITAVQDLEQIRDQLKERIAEAKKRNQELLKEREEEAKTQQELQDKKWTAVSDIDKIASANTAIQHTFGGAS